MTCPFCKSEAIKDQIFANQYILKNLKIKTEIEIKCDTHSKNQSELYCLKEESFVCNKCALLNHHDHVGDLKEIKREELVDFCTKAVTIVDEES